MNNGYAKIRYGHAASNKSGRSIDFSDPQSFPETNGRRSISKPPVEDQDNQIGTTSTAEAEDNNEAIAAKTNKACLVQVLRRNCSVSSASSSRRFKIDDKQQSSYLETAAKKVFSLRRCSSISSDRYCRIHDQTVTLSSSTLYDDDEDMEVKRKKTMPSLEEEEEEDDNKKKKHRRSGKIFKACKRILGL